MLDKEALLRRRRELGISQKKLAELLDVSQATLCNYEKGKAQPRLSIYKLMAKVLGMSRDEL